MLLAGLGSHFCYLVTAHALKRSWTARQSQLRTFGVRGVGDVRQLGVVMSNNYFIIVCVNRNQCPVVIWRRRT